MGAHVDGLKFAGGAYTLSLVSEVWSRTASWLMLGFTHTGSFSLFEQKALREVIDLAHEHNVYISTVRCYRFEVEYEWSNSNLRNRADGQNISLLTLMLNLFLTNISKNARI